MLWNRYSNSAASPCILNLGQFLCISVSYVEVIITLQKQLFCPSVCLSHSPAAAGALGLLLWAQQVEDIDQLQHGAAARCIAATVGRATFSVL